MIPDTTASGYIDNVTKRTTGGTWLALLTADIAESDTLATMDEVLTAGYVRKAVPWVAPAGTPITSTTNADFAFTFTADAALPIVAAALVSAVSGTVGTIQRTYLLNGAYTPKAGDTLTVVAGSLKQGVQ